LNDYAEKRRRKKEGQNGLLTKRRFRVKINRK